MSGIRGIRRIFRVSFRPDHLERDVAEELEFHIRERAEKLIAMGWDPERAHREARRRFGDLQDIRHECYEINLQRKRRMRVKEMIGSIGQDLRFALRTLRGQPAFTAIAILTLVLGTGANIAVFTLLYNILISPLPFPESDRLLYVEESSPAWRIDRMSLSYPDLVDFQNRNRSLAGLAGFWYTDHTFTGHGEPEKIKGCEVSHNFMEVLGVQPVLGRSFRPEEEAEGVAKVAVIGEGLWHRRFGGDPGVVGTTVTLGGEPATIIGVMPGELRFPEFSEIWIPFRNSPVDFRGFNFIGAVGRLRPGVSVQEAGTDLQQIAVGLGEEFWGTDQALGVLISPLRDWIYGGWKEPVIVFYGVVCLVLLLACANIANLLLTRNAARYREVAVRAALGAGRFRNVRQLLTEGLILAMVGGLLGVLAGLIGRNLLVSLSPVELPPHFSFEILPATVLLIGGIITFNWIVFSVGPALAAARLDLRGVLQSVSSRLTGGVQKLRFRSALVVFEVTIALTVLVGANLMVKSLIRQTRVDPGFDPRNVVTMFVTLPDGNYPEIEQITGFYKRVLDEVRALPGIISASIASDLPTGSGGRERNIYVEGTELQASEKSPVYPYSICSTGYFTSLGIPLHRGREFEESHRGDSVPAVAVVNEMFARRYWPDADPVGKRLTTGEGPPEEDSGWSTVIGVAGNTYNSGFGEPVKPQVYYLFDQLPNYDVYLVARTSLETRAAFEQLRSAIHAIDPDIPLSLYRTMDRALLEANWQVRFYSWLFGIFSLIALVLASAGVYSVVSYSVMNRSYEFSIRMAMGADPRRVERMIIRQGLAMSGAGLLAGIALSFGGARFMLGMLFQVNPTDIQVYTISVFAMAAVALLASLVPARRILRIDPMTVLRQE